MIACATIKGLKHIKIFYWLLLLLIELGPKQIAIIIGMTLTSEFTQS
jgi:hypothetical protein